MVTKFSILKMEALYVFKTVVTIYQSTWHKIPEDFSLHIPSYSNRYSFVLPAFVVVTLKMVAVGFLHSYVSLHYHTSLQSRRNCIVVLKLSENQVNMKHQ